ncbi:MAG: MerR family transcriptional regulator [Thermoleophilia bacterium]|nr:MerR family transcriptional regulator [Thermoleophilia bacterium]
MSSTDRAAGPRTITEVATIAGLSAHTLRYYERIGLLDPVPRVHGGQRRYGAGDLAWLAFVQRLRATGMPIRDMRRFAELRREGDHTIGERRELLERHRTEVLARIAELERDLTAVTGKITTYRNLETAHDPRQPDA